MWLNKNDNTVIKKPIAVVVNGVQHPSIIFSKWSEAELNSINIFTITEDSIPNRRYYTYNESLDYQTAHISRTPIEKPLSDVQSLLIKDLEQTANNKFEAVTSGYTASEMASWKDMEAEALSHATTPLTSGLIFDEALFGGITVDELVAKVLFNATTFKQAKAYIAGTRKKKELEILALVDVNACIEYENTPYDYTITAEDVAIDDTLVEGDIVTRYTNQVKDW